MIVLTNGQVAWPLGGRIGRWYFESVYLPPEGWTVIAHDLSTPYCDREVCGVYRFKEGHTFIVEVNHA